MKKILVPIADGCEEIETLTIIDVARRAGGDVTSASIMPGRTWVEASRGVKLEADIELLDCPDIEWDLIALPGGLPGAEHLQHCEALIELIKRQLHEGRLLAAICASPLMVLGRNGLIGTRTVTCYPSFQMELSKCAHQVSTDRVVVDGNLVTSQGPGTSIEFSLELVSLLYGDGKAKEISAELVF